MASTARRRAAALAVTVGVAVAAPVFYPVYSVARRSPPAHAASLLGGAWRGEDALGDVHQLRFNRFNMAALALPSLDVARKGPVTFSADALVVEPVPLPLLSALSDPPTTLPVTQWPCDANGNVLIVGGIAYTRV